MSKFKHTKKLMGYDDGGKVLPSQGEIRQGSLSDSLGFKLRELLAKPGSRLDQMTKSDEEQKQNDFYKDNLKNDYMWKHSHSVMDEPSDEEVKQARENMEMLTSMGMMSGGIKNVGKLLTNPKIAEVAEAYLNSKGMKIGPTPKVNVNPDTGSKIAKAYEEMAHNPNAPEVKNSYDALINETKDQFKAIKDTGLKMEPIQQGMKNPYSNSQDMIKDVHENNHMWYYPTEQGFGNGKVSDHPLLKSSGEVINGKEVPANDIFRIVHDYFGHAKEGHQFGPKGEENAWMLHKQMYSPEAQKALTTETRGQNSWVNYGPMGQANRANPANTVYAEQKAGILPSWAQEKTNIDNTPVVSTDPNIRMQADANETALKDMMNQNKMQKLQEATAPREVIPEHDANLEELERMSMSQEANGGMPPARPDYSITPEQIKENLRRLGRGSNF